MSPNKGLRNAGRRRCGPLRLVLCEACSPPCSNPDHAHPKNEGYDCQRQGSLWLSHCSSVCNCHVSWIGSCNPCAQAHDGGLRGGPAGDCEMPLWYGSRCRANNLREGAMVPLHGTCLLEVRAPVGRQDSGGLILSHWHSTPVTSQYSPLKLFTPRARRSCHLG